MTISVAIVDDDDFAVSAISEALARLPEILLVAASPDVAKLVEQIHGAPPDVVVLDVMLGRRSSGLAENVARLRQWGTRVLATSSQPDRADILESVRRQQLNFLAKQDLRDDQTFLAAIRATAGDDRVLSPQFITDVLLQEGKGTPRLTPRETQVMRLSAAGLTAGQVARRLAVREDTIRGHLKRISEKYDEAGRPIDNPVRRYFEAVYDNILPDPDDPGHDDGTQEP
ncbi:DNA-binding NarL/FixJ family response regulator [Catenulispora sp. MAP12-49]|uniref:response regulator transcription factor n=1 Tax=Catenulispora sp. MAP12-49 TaxID=3156302 RepID=UPI003512F027